MRVLAGALTVFFGAWTICEARGVEHVSLTRDGREHHVAGKVLVEAKDGGMLLLASDGTLWIIQPEEVVRRHADAEDFRPLTGEEAAAQLLAAMPAGFKVHRTSRYVVCYNTSDAYAEWCGGLYERLYRGFHAFWKNNGFELQPPEFPLIALLFTDHASYLRYAHEELGQQVGARFGYYNVQTNRVTSYDLTGIDELRKGQRQGSTASHIQQILAQPAAERTVATVVHEATHQLAYNSGLQIRYADNPVWVSEGIAAFFETPDFSSAKGWRSIGSVNPVHMTNFRQLAGSRPPDALRTLLTEDLQFRDPETSTMAYCTAWALNYYLLRARRAEYVAYLRELANGQPLAERTAEERVAHFERIFGTDLRTLDEKFVRYMSKVR